MAAQLISDHHFTTLADAQAKCICSQPNYMGKEYIDVIMSFSEFPQAHFSINAPHKLSEEEFIIFILGVLNKPKLQSLYKISMCLYYSQGIHCYDYIFQTSGKYYFDTNINNDPHTHKFNNIRTILLETDACPNIRALAAIIPDDEKPKPESQTRTSIGTAEQLVTKGEPKTGTAFYLSLIAATNKIMFDRITHIKTQLCAQNITFTLITCSFNKQDDFIFFQPLPDSLTEPELVRFILSKLSKNKLKSIQRLTFRMIHKNSHAKYINKKIYYFDVELDAEAEPWHEIKKQLLKNGIPEDGNKYEMFDISDIIMRTLHDLHRLLIKDKFDENIMKVIINTARDYALSVIAQ